MDDDKQPGEMAPIPSLSQEFVRLLSTGHAGATVSCNVMDRFTIEDVAEIKFVDGDKSPIV